MRRAILALLVLAGAAWGQTPRHEHNVYLNESTSEEQFKVRVSQLDTTEQWFWCWLNATNTMCVTNFSVAYRWGTNQYAADVSAMSTINGVFSNRYSNLVIVRPASNEWQRLADETYAALYFTKGAGKHTVARGTHTVVRSPEKSGTTVPFVATIPVDWSTLGPHGSVTTHFPLLPGSNITFRAVLSGGRYYIDMNVANVVQTTDQVYQRVITNLVVSWSSANAYAITGRTGYLAIGTNFVTAATLGALTGASNLPAAKVVGNLPSASVSNVLSSYSTTVAMRNELGGTNGLLSAQIALRLTISGANASNALLRAEMVAMTNVYAAAVGDARWINASGDTMTGDLVVSGTNRLSATRIGLLSGQGAGHSWSNFFAGYCAGQLSVLGRFQVGVGPWAGYTSSGDGWAAMGYAGVASDGDWWSAMGNGGNYSTGNYWTATGYRAGERCVGNDWTASGWFAGYRVVGSRWLALGNSAGYDSGGSDWTAVGRLAGALSTGEQWSALGHAAGYGARWTNSAAFGPWAGRRARGRNRFYLDARSSDPGVGHDGTYDAIFLDDGTLYLGRTNKTVTVRGPTLTLPGGSVFRTTGGTMTNVSLPPNLGMTFDRLSSSYPSGTMADGSSVNRGLITSLTGGSVATRVNEMIVANLGATASELVWNPGMTNTAAGWTLVSNATFQASGSYSNTIRITAGLVGEIAPTGKLALASGEIYVAQYTLYILGSSGVVTTIMGGRTNVAAYTASQTATIAHPTTTTNSLKLRVRAPAGYDVYVDNVSVRRATDGDLWVADQLNVRGTARLYGGLDTSLNMLGHGFYNVNNIGNFTANDAAVYDTAGTGCGIWVYEADVGSFTLGYDVHNAWVIGRLGGMLGSPAIATNEASASLGVFDLLSDERQRFSSAGTGSIGVGGCDVTNRHALVVGSGIGSAGDDSIATKHLRTTTLTTVSFTNYFGSTANWIACEPAHTQFVFRVGAVCWTNSP